MGEIYSEKLYIGIDIGKESVMLSYYHTGLKMPRTVSTVAGSGQYQIPLVIAKRHGIGQWVYAEEALHLCEEKKGTLVDNLLERAAEKETVSVDGTDYEAVELLILYFKKILRTPNRLDVERPIEKVVFGIRRIDSRYIELFEEVRRRLGLEKQQFEMIDHKECFYFYSYHQEEMLKQHEVFLFDYYENRMECFELSRKRGTQPVVIEIEQHQLGELTQPYDDHFLQMAQSVMGKKLISAVYFVGDIFEGDWMQESLRYICRGRRAFVGKNLYSMGACYASYLKGNEEKWNYVYLGESEFKINISLKVQDKSELKFYTLIEAGENWYHNVHSCDVLLDDTNTVDLWLQYPFGREAKIENLELADLPERPNKTTRISVTARALSDRKAEIIIYDLGFGEFFPSSGKVWKYTMEF